MDTIPVYVIAGLLESGKTTFIKDTIASDDFFKKGKTLILSGEEGIEEYEESFLDAYNSVVKYLVLVFRCDIEPFVEGFAVGLDAALGKFFTQKSAL